MTASFVAIDFETANSARGSACEIGLVRVVDGKVEARFSTLLKPHPQFSGFSPMNVSVHGISESDVAGAPDFAAIWPEVSEFIGALPLVAHNASFDTGVLRALFGIYAIEVPSMRYFCTLVIARRALDLVSYSLPFVAEALSVSHRGDHRADTDALCAAEVALGLLADGRVATMEHLSDLYEVSSGYFDSTSWSGSRHTGGSSSVGFSASTIELIRRTHGSAAADPDGALFEKRVAFTGKLASLTRAEAAAKVLSAGGEPEVNVTKNTDFLVIGTENGYTIDQRTAVTGKFAKAAKLRGAGSKIEVLDELSFIAML
ncbi:exonuclease domain-containing protein [Conyzicola sp.]|uniref:exonuclease domain-containing protein n=1 Tax=Conyzicola sp. TaxID=1969404 RepID=UPI003989BC6D